MTGPGRTGSPSGSRAGPWQTRCGQQDPASGRRTHVAWLLGSARSGLILNSARRNARTGLRSTVRVSGREGSLREKFGGFPTGSRDYPDRLPAVRLVARVSQQDSRGISWSPRNSIECGPASEDPRDSIGVYHSGVPKTRLHCHTLHPNLSKFFTLYYNHLHLVNYNLLPHTLQLKIVQYLDLPHIANNTGTFGHTFVPQTAFYTTKVAFYKMSALLSPSIKPSIG